MIRRRKSLDKSQSRKSYANSSSPMPPKRSRTSWAGASASTSISPRKSYLPDPSFVGGEPAAPTHEEWQRMTPYQSFIVTDGQGEQQRFPLHAYALILPEGANPNGTLGLRGYWVGKIKEIRARDGDSFDVWANVQWLWSIEDLLGSRPRYPVDPATFGKMERALSDHFDFVHTSCFSDIARVASYVESDPEPRPINEETFYYRRTWSVLARELAPKSIPTCFCRGTYNANETPIMHFCPRKGCCRTFHADCLRQAGLIEKPRKDLASRRALQFERTLPSPNGEEEEEEEEEEDLIRPPVSSAPSSTLIAPPLSSYRLPDTNAISNTNNHNNLPPELLTLARSPMIKGVGSDLPYEWSCVTGNFAVVTRARRLVRDVIERGQRLPNKWAAFLEIPGEEDNEDVDMKTVTSWAVDDVDLFLCPTCKGAI